MELGLILTKFWSKSSTLGFNIGQILVDPGWISKWKIIKERQNYWNFGWLLHRMLVSIQLQKSQVFRRIHQFDNNQYLCVSAGIPPASIDFLYERYLWLFVSNIHCIDCLDNVRWTGMNLHMQKRLIIKLEFNFQFLFFLKRPLAVDIRPGSMRIVKSDPKNPSESLFFF